jgi:predicted Rossmann fold nucleotide-binding protein DprA/Smf involved in DNA uptake
MGLGASFDELVERLGWGAAELSVALSRAELAGRVVRGVGERYRPR